MSSWTLMPSKEHSVHSEAASVTSYAELVDKNQKDVQPRQDLLLEPTFPQTFKSMKIPDDEGDPHEAAQKVNADNAKDGSSYGNSGDNEDQKSGQHSALENMTPAMQWVIGSANNSARTAKQTLVTLPEDVLYNLIECLDPVASICLGLTCKKVYAIHWDTHGGVGMNRFTTAYGRAAGVEGMFQYYLCDLLEEWMGKQGYVKCYDGWVRAANRQWGTMPCVCASSKKNSSPATGSECKCWIVG